MFHCSQAPGYFIIPQCSIVLWFAWSAHPQMTPQSFGHLYVFMFLQFPCQCQLAVSIMLQTLCGTVMCSCSGQIGLDARWNRALDCGSDCKILQVFVWSDISRETRLWYTLINWYALIFPSDTVTVISKILHAGDDKLSLQEIPPAFVPSCANWFSHGWLGGDSQHFVHFVEMSGLGSFHPKAAPQKVRWCEKNLRLSADRATWSANPKRWTDQSWLNWIRRSSQVTLNLPNQIHTISYIITWHSRKRGYDFQFLLLGGQFSYDLIVSHRHWSVSWQKSVLEFLISFAWRQPRELRSLLWMLVTKHCSAILVQSLWMTVLSIAGTPMRPWAEANKLQLPKCRIWNCDFVWKSSWWKQMRLLKICTLNGMLRRWLGGPWRHLRPL